MAYLQNFMIETTEIYDYRMNKSADRFFAGTIKHKLILRDVKGKQTYSEYDYEHDEFYDTQLIIDTKNKTIEFPIIYTATNNAADFVEKYTGNQQYIKRFFNDLLKHGIIDTTYKISHNIEKHYVTGNLILYHGTSSSVIDNIKRVGLKPIDTETLAKEYQSVYRGNLSTIVTHTDQNIYLTPSEHLAYLYAKSQAKKRNDNPVVIEVTVPDMTKLLVDDDYIQNRIRKLVSTILLHGVIKKDEYFNEFYNKIINQKILNIVLTNDESSTEELKYIGRKYGYEEKIDMILENVKSEYEKLSKTNYFKSIIGKDNAVAYRGRIPAKFLNFKYLKPEPIKESGLKKLNNFEKTLLLLR